MNWEKRVMENFSADENVEKLMESSQWGNLKAVKDNRVFYIDTSLWVEGCGVVGQSIIIDQIVSSLMSRQKDGLFMHSNQLIVHHILKNMVSK